MCFKTCAIVLSHVIVFLFMATEGYASQVADTADVYLVPAFSGLFAPYWQAPEGE